MPVARDGARKLDVGGKVMCAILRTGLDAAGLQHNDIVSEQRERASAVTRGKGSVESIDNVDDIR